MWRLVKEELRCYGTTLLIAWGFGIGIFALVVAIIALVGSTKDLRELPGLVTQAPISILVASLIAGFIATGTERSENRVRLLLLLPVPVVEVALARVLVPTVLMLLGTIAAHAVSALALALRGAPLSLGRQLTVDFMGLQLLFWIQFALAVREVIELHRRVRWHTALWADALVGLLVALAVATSIAAHILPTPVAVRVAAIAAIDAATMVLAMALFVRRVQFTK
jgi:hypothetical protein